MELQDYFLFFKTHKYVRGSLFRESTLISPHFLKLVKSEKEVSHLCNS